MSITLYTNHRLTSEAHCLAVMAEMRTLGAPTIRVVDCGDHLQALEGRHRLEAARRLGVPVRLVVLAQNDLVAADSLDWDTLNTGEQYEAWELAGELATPMRDVYTDRDLVFEIAA